MFLLQLEEGGDSTGSCGFLANRSAWRKVRIKGGGRQLGTVFLQPFLNHGSCQTLMHSRLTCVTLVPASVGFPLVFALLPWLFALVDEGLLALLCLMCNGPAWFRSAPCPHRFWPVSLRRVCKCRSGPGRVCVARPLCRGCGFGLPSPKLPGPHHIGVAVDEVHCLGPQESCGSCGPGQDQGSLCASGFVHASQTELTWTITLVGVWMYCAKVRSPWQMALALDWAPRAMPVMVPFLCRAPNK